MSTLKMNSLFCTIILLGLCRIHTQSQLFHLVLLSQQRGAACLDGSPPGFYIHEGSGQNKNNYLIYFKGGGFCGQRTLEATIQNCYKRSFTQRGTTKNIPESFNTTGRGIVSTVQSQNPLFFDWTILVVNYCDGHQYAGHRENPIPYKDRQLYFRGSRNVKQLFYYMDKKYDFYNGEKIIITGGSAGGICTFQWSNYLVDNTKKAKIYAIPDSGFFITDYYTPLAQKKVLRQYLQPLFNLVFNETEMPEPITQCMKNPEFDMVDCFNAANYAKYLKAPTFMVQSPYDEWSLHNIVGAKCLTNRDDPYSLQTCNSTVRQAIEEYRLSSINYLKKIRSISQSFGIWGPACVQHCYEHQQSYNSADFVVKQNTLMMAIKKFMQKPNETEWLLDQIPWPENKGCNGIQKRNNFLSNIQ